MSRPNNNRKSYKPKAAGYSAQGISDVTTPQGKSMLDEEFRRIEQGLKNLQKPPAAPVAAVASSPTASGAASEPKPATQKLTLKHNSINVIQNVTEVINVEDSNSIIFDVVATSPREAKISGRAANDGLYKAKRVGEILYSDNGSTFRPEWPLTSLETGIILTQDGIIMIVG